MLICILGFSASGKDHIVGRICNKSEYNRIVQFTTRPIRNNEINGGDYNFIDNKTFQGMIDEEAFISYRAFETVSGTYYYGIGKSSLKDKSNNIICIDIEGLNELIAKCNTEQIVSIFIEAEYKIRRYRAEKRSNFDSNEFDRRYRDDMKKLDSIKGKCNYIVSNNTNSDDCVSEICNILSNLKAVNATN